MLRRKSISVLEDPLSKTMKVSSSKARETKDVGLPYQDRPAVAHVDNSSKGNQGER